MERDQEFESGVAHGHSLSDRILRILDLVDMRKVLRDAFNEREVGFVFDMIEERDASLYFLALYLSELVGGEHGVRSNLLAHSRSPEVLGETLDEFISGVQGIGADDVKNKVWELFTNQNVEHRMGLVLLAVNFFKEGIDSVRRMVKVIVGAAQKSDDALWSAMYREQGAAVSRWLDENPIDPEE